MSLSSAKGSISDTPLDRLSDGTTDLSNELDGAHVEKKSSLPSIELSAQYSQPFNDSFDEYICGALTADAYATVEILGLGDVRLILPDCIANRTIEELVLKRLIVESFESLPTSLTAISMEYCYLIRPTGAASSLFDGFNADGTISWPEVWDRFSSLSSLAIKYSQLRGVLGPLPTRLRFFDVQFNLLTGDGLNSLFEEVDENNVSPFKVDLSYNPLNTTLPQNLFDPFRGLKAPSSFEFLARDCNLNGTLASALLSPFLGALFHTFKLDLGRNNLSGSLPFSFLPIDLLSTSVITPSFSLRLAHNSFSGSLPFDMFSPLTRLGAFEFRAEECGLSGTLPNLLFPSGLLTTSGATNFILSLSSNNISGSIPETFLALTADNVTFKNVELLLNSNHLSGSIPENLFWSLNPNLRRHVNIAMSGHQIAPEYRWMTSNLFFTIASNSLTGSLPPRLFSYLGVSQAPLFYRLYANQNNLIGSLPAQYFDDIHHDDDEGTFELFVSHNRISGSLPSSCRRTVRTAILAAHNQLSGTIPTAWSSCALERIEIDENKGISGSIPPELFKVSALTRFSARGTSLTGTVPNIGESLHTLHLSNTMLSFCSTSFSPRSGMVCDISQTDACRCASDYDDVCAMSCTPATLPPLLCPLSTRPSPDFFCINGIWTTTNVNTPTLVIPPRTGIVIITGNLSSTSLILNGIDSSVQVSGCAINLTSIQVNLDKDQVDQLGKSRLQQLITLTGNSTNSSCGNDWSNVTIDSKVSDSGCKKVKVTKVASSDSNTLSALFSVDSSSCNLWWIILASVVGGVVVLAVIVVALMAAFCPAFRNKIRPYHRRTAAATR